jgi:hypothetical protein
MEPQSRIINGSILEQIRQAPLMYLGERSLSSVYHYISGYSLAEAQHGVQTSKLVPDGFHDWVAYRLHHLESTSGYRNMILNRIPNESDALDRFFELLDEYHSRKAKVIAEVLAHPRRPDIFKQEQGSEEKKRVTVAEVVQLVTYTDDPGFFVLHDEASAEWPSQRHNFRPSLSWLEVPYRPAPEYVTILDQREFNRLVRESEEFEEKRRKNSKLGESNPD